MADRISTSARRTATPSVTAISAALNPIPKESRSNSWSAELIPPSTARTSASSRPWLSAARRDPIHARLPGGSGSHLAALPVGSTGEPIERDGIPRYFQCLTPKDDVTCQSNQIAVVLRLSMSAVDDSGESSPPPTVPAGVATGPEQRPKAGKVQGRFIAADEDKFPSACRLKHVLLRKFAR